MARTARTTRSRTVSSGSRSSGHMAGSTGRAGLPMEPSASTAAPRTSAIFVRERPHERWHDLFMGAARVGQQSGRLGAQCGIIASQRLEEPRERRLAAWCLQERGRGVEPHSGAAVGEGGGEDVRYSLSRWPARHQEHRRRHAHRVVAILAEAARGVRDHVFGCRVNPAERERGAAPHFRRHISAQQLQQRCHRGTGGRRADLLEGVRRRLTNVGERIGQIGQQPGNSRGQRAAAIRDGHFRHRGGGAHAPVRILG